MDALCANSESNVDPIIDNQRHIISFGQLMKLLGGFDQCVGVTMLVTVLDNRDTCQKPKIESPS
jgi:hypothetical protein